VSLNLQSAEFIKSAANPADLIQTSMPLICFSGKSNVGKSSVINRLLNRRDFARVGAKPGKTVHVNYFSVDGKVLFADLPGYGYAQVGQVEKARWAKLCEEFFSTQALTLGVMIVDSRHKPTADDQTMAAWYRETGSHVVVVANKLDKVKKSELAGNLLTIEATLALPDAEVLPFSAETGAGRDALVAIINRAVG
jgi:GTP-binding protein